MGFFSKSAPRPSTKVWKTEQAYLKGIAREALLSLKNNETTAVISFFEDSHQKITAFLSSSGVTYNSINSFSGKDVMNMPSTIHIIDASSGSISRNIGSQDKINILFLGHYPYLPVEKRLIDQLTSQFPAGNISFCLSLDSAIFDALGADRLKPLMEQLGMKDDEFIEHAMVTTAISRAMEKLEKQMTSESKAHSEKEWFLKNLKS